ncbi:MAG: FkbM family methyltransferase [Flavobacterium sp.]|nr:MAG: FkbM family methyltransferase [Flavobacterium sp.]
MNGKLLKSLIPSKYKRAIKEHLGVPSLHWSLQNLKKKGFKPDFVVDIGAYEGLWTLALFEIFPQAKVLMVEAQACKEPHLESIRFKYPQADYAINLLSSCDSVEKFFFANETASHVTDSPDAKASVMQALTLDTLLLQKRLAFPDFIKVDVQGHEKEVLMGAKNSLAHATVCLLEISLLSIDGHEPLLAEMIHFMDTKGFQAYDISQFIRRPFDKSLYQIDIFFAKKDSFLTNESRW